MTDEKKLQVYRHALNAAERALMHAMKFLPPDSRVHRLVADTLEDVTKVLDIGRDEANEQVAT